MQIYLILYWKDYMEFWEELYKKIDKLRFDNEKTQIKPG